MDRRIEADLENYLRGTLDARQLAGFEQAVEASGAEAKTMIRRFERQSELIRSLRPPGRIEPAPGFYGRVLDRIQAQKPASLWSAFIEPVFFRRLVFAAATLLLLLSVTIVTSNPDEEITTAMESAPEMVMASDPEPIGAMTVSTPEEGRDMVLVDLTTYQE